jgi:hypothetical protein
LNNDAAYALVGLMRHRKRRFINAFFVFKDATLLALVAKMKLSDEYVKI